MIPLAALLIALHCLGTWNDMAERSGWAGRVPETASAVANVGVIAVLVAAFMALAWWQVLILIAVSSLAISVMLRLEPTYQPE